MEELMLPANALQSYCPVALGKDVARVILQALKNSVAKLYFYYCR